MKIKYFIVAHYFQVVQNNFSIPCDGIIGMDFIKKYNCILDFNYENDYFILRPSNLTHSISIPITYEQNEIVLPPRSEVIREVRFANLKNDICSCAKS